MSRALPRAQGRLIIATADDRAPAPGRIGARAAVPVVVTAGVLAAWMTWPLVAQPGSTVIADEPSVRIALADVLLNMWILSWAPYAWQTGQPYFDAGMFFPHTNTLALSEHLVGYLPLYLPTFLLTSNPVLALNVSILATLTLGFLGSYWLLRVYGLGVWAASFGAAVIIFSTPRLVLLRSGEPHLLAQWTPVLFAAMARYLAGARARWLLLASAALFLQLASSYYLAYMVVLAAPVGLLMAIGRAGRGTTFGRVAMLCAALGLSLAPFYMLTRPYLRVSEKTLQGGADAMWLTANSADALESYVSCIPSGGHSPYRGVLRGCTQVMASPQRRLFAGFVPLTLALVGLLAGLGVAWRRARHRADTHEQRGYGSLVLGGVLLTVLFAVLSFGPTLIARGVQVIWDGTPVTLPYATLQEHVPGFASLRAPARFGLFTMLGIGILAACGLEAVLRRVTRRGRSAWGAALASALLAAGVAEHSYAPHATVTVQVGDRIPRVYRWLREHGAGLPLLELPMGGDFWDRAPLYVYYSIAHRLPIVNGYSGHFPPGYLRDTAPLRAAWNRERFLAAVGTSGAAWVTVHDARRGMGRKISTWLNSAASLHLVGVFDDTVLYRVLRSPSPSPST